jgi:DNA polymerase I-like protein with 3'-5' exonuclease and polymerase domains
VEEEVVEEFIPVARNTMQNAVKDKMLVLMEVDFKAGTKWGSMKGIGGH